MEPLHVGDNMLILRR